MRDFFNELFETGHVSVSTEPRLVQGLRSNLSEVTRDFDRVSRLNHPGIAPELKMSVALWAGSLIYDCCQLLVLRNLGEAQIASVLSSPCPESDLLPSTLYSADLFLSYLPGILEQGRRLAPGDPLIEHLENFGKQWPLSCVGMRLKGRPISVTAILEHPGLKQLYVDRIIEFRAYSWIENWALVQAVRSSYGDHAFLCPDLAQAMETIIDGQSLTPLSKTSSELNPVNS